MLVIQVCMVGLKYKFDVDVCVFYYGLSDGYLWDNGVDFIEEFDYLLVVCQVVFNKMGLNMLLFGVSLLLLENVLVFVYLLYRYQLEVVVKQVGGIEYEYENKGDNSSVKGVKFVVVSM